MERRGQEVLYDPGSKGTCERAAAERRLIQKLKSYHHPEDTGACLGPSDINPGAMLPTVSRAHTGYTCSSKAKPKLANSLYPFLHLQLRSVSVAFLPLKRQQRTVQESRPDGSSEPLQAVAVNPASRLYLRGLL